MNRAPTVQKPCAHALIPHIMMMPPTCGDPQGISAREYAFISGQLPIDPATGAFPSEDIAAQTRQSLLNLKAIIEANGMTMADVVKTTVLLADINEFGAMNEVYGEFFAEPYPARAAFQVAALPKNARVEIEAVAVKR